MGEPRGTSQFDHHEFHDLGAWRVRHHELPVPFLYSFGDARIRSFADHTDGPNRILLPAFHPYRGDAFLGVFRVVYEYAFSSPGAPCHRASAPHRCNR